MKVFSDVSRPPWAYADALRPYQNVTRTLYVLTDEAKRSYFNVFRSYDFDLVFWDDLPAELFRWILERYPQRMFFDVLGIVEQLVAAGAHRFLGSSYSTFSSFVLRLRKHRVTMLHARRGAWTLSPTIECTDQKQAFERMKALDH